MDSPQADDPARPRRTVDDPGPTIRRWVAFILRVGIGLCLLNFGLAGYLATAGGAPGFGPTPNAFAAISPFVAALPFLAIGIGLALILGFLTTAASIAAACFMLLIPIVITVSITGGGQAIFPFYYQPARSMELPLIVAACYLPSLIPQVALIWLSSPENHPISVDALIFGQADPADRPTFRRPPAAPSRTPPPEAPEASSPV